MQQPNPDVVAAAKDQVVQARARTPPAKPAPAKKADPPAAEQPVDLAGVADDTKPVKRAPGRPRKHPLPAQVAVKPEAAREEAPAPAPETPDAPEPALPEPELEPAVAAVIAAAPSPDATPAPLAMPTWDEGKIKLYVKAQVAKALLKHSSSIGSNIAAAAPAPEPTPVAEAPKPPPTPRNPQLDALRRGLANELRVVTQGIPFRP